MNSVRGMKFGINLELVIVFFFFLKLFKHMFTCKDTMSGIEVKYIYIFYMCNHIVN